MGKLGLAFSLGVMAGPLFGGFVAEKFGDHMVALSASITSLLSVLMVQIFLPKHTKSLNKQETPSGVISFKVMKTYNQLCNDSCHCQPQNCYNSSFLSIACRCSVRTQVRCACERRHA